MPVSRINHDGIDTGLDQGFYARFRTFTPVGTPDQRACKVELDLSYGFDNLALGKLVGPVFDKIAASLMDAFVKRAEKIYV